uniref:KRAB domain-containing protein n=1 Tax=Crocodylus porosus TaxID=8502 RepID=A0A7M4EIC1_CROPO
RVTSTLPQIVPSSGRTRKGNGCRGGPVTFEEMPAYFSEGQWDLLNPSQKAFCRDVIGKGFSGFPVPKPSVVSWMEKQKEPWATDLLGSEQKELLGEVCTGKQELAKLTWKLLARKKSLHLGNWHLGNWPLILPSPHWLFWFLPSFPHSPL